MFFADKQGHGTVILAEFFGYLTLASEISIGGRMMALSDNSAVTHRLLTPICSPDIELSSP